MDEGIRRTLFNAEVAEFLSSIPTPIQRQLMCAQLKMVYDALPDTITTSHSEIIGGDALPIETPDTGEPQAGSSDQLPDSGSDAPADPAYSSEAVNSHPVNAAVAIRVINRVNSEKVEVLDKALELECEWALNIANGSVLTPSGG